MKKWSGVSNGPTGWSGTKGSAKKFTWWSLLESSKKFVSISTAVHWKAQNSKIKEEKVNGTFCSIIEYQPLHSPRSHHLRKYARHCHNACVRRASVRLHCACVTETTVHFSCLCVLVGKKKWNVRRIFQSVFSLLLGLGFNFRGREMNYETPVKDGPINVTACVENFCDKREKWLL